MIKSISIKNFRSIKDPLVLDMERSGRKKSELYNYRNTGNFELTLSTVIYGANASGKSNVLKAFKALEYLVLHSSRFDPESKINPYEPFRLSVNSKEKPVEIELDFFTDSIRYVYTVHFTLQRIEFERLVFYPNGREALLFERKAAEEIDFGQYFQGEKKAIEKLTLPNQLFLSKAASNNAESCLPVFQFFKSGIQIFPFLYPHQESGLERLFARQLAENPESDFANKLNALICALDTGISKITVKEEDISQLKFPENLPLEIKTKLLEDYRYRIRTVHDLFDQNGEKIGTEEFDITEESSGTRSMIPMAGLILEALEKGQVLIMDEFEKNLHPMITSYLIQLFHNELTNPSKAQLILATHDITQLNEETFNRDQIWFTEKNGYGATELYRCSNINGLRINAPLDKWYMSGRLGATAIINDVDFIIAMQEEKEIV